MKQGFEETRDMATICSLEGEFPRRLRRSSWSSVCVCRYAVRRCIFALSASRTQDSRWGPTLTRSRNKWLWLLQLGER